MRSGTSATVASRASARFQALARRKARAALPRQISG